ncbi:hypothetical protein SSX86_018368 [Deinandra increscens subsp. villosa]|uniref:Uncharacterized protein n=1 Tax=Deinandra increscens subsp. villosa TaxID=3103831 RepID=A0AAP0CV64_9ASTR
MALLPDLEHLRIPFDGIKSATNNFSHQNFLGQGGFGPVYKAKLPSSTGSSDQQGINVAVKRLDAKGMQGQHEFLTEIVMLASYKHDNLVSLVGFCDEGNEKVLVYKHEVNGSLDNHLSSTNLTCEQRLQICVGAARGLEYLHDGVGASHRVLHRDIKSSNILLDANWKAKGPFSCGKCFLISDFGLSKIGPTNQEFTFLVTSACGTFGYVDPLYVNTGVLTKESDVYSFGVVLFEVLCGRPAMIVNYEDKRRFLSGLVKLHQENETLHKIIMPSLLEQMKPYSLQVFSNIAFQCLNTDRKQRPTMGFIVKCLETALKHQLGTLTKLGGSLMGTGGLLRTKLWGSATGGSPFLFQLGSNQKLWKITIYHFRWIHSLVFTTKDPYGLLHASEQYGGFSDHDREKMFVLHFDAEEEIIGISGTVGMCYGLELITSLSLATNLKNYGPFGEGWGSTASFSESWDWGLFDGFYGRCGSYLDAVGCCLKNII